MEILVRKYFREQRRRGIDKVVFVRHYGANEIPLEGSGGDDIAGEAQITCFLMIDWRTGGVRLFARVQMDANEEGEMGERK